MKKVIFLVIGLFAAPAFAETYDCTGIGAGYIAVTGDVVQFVNWTGPGINKPGKIISRSYDQLVLDYSDGQGTVILNPAGNGQYKYPHPQIEVPEFL